jgi:tRNA A-37 threonylcarbamoyl transferase component Bud32
VFPLALIALVLFVVAVRTGALSPLRETVRRLAAWGLLAALAGAGGGFLLLLRATEPHLARDTSFDRFRPDEFALYWLAVIALFGFAGYTLDRRRPGFWGRLRGWFVAPPPATPADAWRRAVRFGLAAFAGGCFADWVATGRFPVVPLHLFVGTLVALAVGLLGTRPVRLPWADRLGPAGRRAAANVAFGLMLLVWAVALMLTAAAGSPARGLAVLLGLLAAGGWAARRLARWAYPEWFAAAAVPVPVAVASAAAVVPGGRDEPGRPPAEAKPCPRCGAAAAGPLGLCPKCLLQAALASQEAEPNRTSPYRGGGVVPPTPAEVQEFFPHLEVLALVGHGGMGAVYKARQPALDRVVALKLIRPREDDPTYAERFAREAKALARLSHPNVVTVHETGEAGGSLYLLMEYVEGVTLREPMRARAFAPAQALDVVGQVCAALQYAHAKGVVHRDIKPENILLDKAGRVKIADFGLAKVADSDGVSLTRTHQAMGTPHYMAPEQWERPAAVDHRADMFALGVVIYELLTGELPLGRFDPPSRRAAVDARLDEVVLRLLDKDPGRRFQAAGDVGTAVERIRTRPAAAVPPPRRSAFAGWQVAVCLLGAAAAAVPQWSMTDPFWGLTGTAQWDDEATRVTEVEPGSPADMAGLRYDDRVARVDGRRYPRGGLGPLLRRLRPGEAAELTVVRDGRTLTLTAVAVEPRLEHVRYFYWQFAAAGGFAALAAVLAAAGRARPPWWPPALALVAGAGGAVALAAAPEWLNASTVLRRDWAIAHPPVLYGTLKWAVAAVAAVLGLLGAAELRRRHTPAAAPVEEPAAPPAAPTPDARRGGFEYRSRWALFGWPLVHVKFGGDPATGKPAVARGVIAVGDTAVGAVAVGGMAVGGVAFGGMAVGLLAAAGVAMGLFAAGGAGIGLLAGVGGLGTGVVAVGGGAAGYYTYGGGAIGERPLGHTAAVPWAEVPGHLAEWADELQDPVNGRHPDNPWRPSPITQAIYPWLGPAVGGLALLLAAVLGGGAWLRGRVSEYARVHLTMAGVMLLFVGGFVIAGFVLPLPLQLLAWVLYGPALVGLIRWGNGELVRARAAG